MLLQNNSVNTDTITKFVEALKLTKYLNNAIDYSELPTSNNNWYVITKQPKQSKQLTDIVRKFARYNEQALPHNTYSLYSGKWKPFLLKLANALLQYQPEPFVFADKCDNLYTFYTPLGYLMVDEASTIVVNKVLGDA